MLTSNKLVLILALLTISFIMNAEDLGMIKQRMKERAQLINVLKEKGFVGENNQGFLKSKKDNPKEDIVKAENTDRALVYQVIAEKMNTTPDVVGVRRAEQISSDAPSGTIIQGKDGNWYRKS